MVKKSKGSKGNKKKSASNKAKQKNGKNGGRGKVLPASVANYMQLVKDPCAGPLVKSIGTDLGASIIERARGVQTFPTGAGNGNGYIAWFPGFHNGTGVAGYRPANCYVWENASAGVRPLNTVADPMGTTIATSGLFIPDPGAALIGSTSAFSRAKTSAACISMFTTLPVSSVRGQIAMVMRMSLAAFDQNNGAVGLAFQPPSVNELLAYAANRERMQLDGHELIWGPTSRDTQLRTNGRTSEGTAIDSHTEPDAAFWYGVPGTTQTKVATPDPNNVMGIVMVFQGLASTVGEQTITLTKVVELELAPRSGAIEEAPRGRTEPVTPGFSVVDEVTNYLDANVPSWRVRAVHAGVNMASYAAQTVARAFTGTRHMAIEDVGRQRLRGA